MQEYVLSKSLAASSLAKPGVDNPAITFDVLPVHTFLNVFMGSMLNF